jgi:hypothetical protein
VEGFKFIPESCKFRVQSSWFCAWGSRFGVKDSGFRVWVVEFRIQAEDLGTGVY